MIEDIKYQFSIANDQKVVKLADQFLAMSDNSRNLVVLNYKAQAHKNLFQDELCISTK